MEVLQTFYCLNNNQIFFHTQRLKETVKENDPVNHPKHYTDGRIEVIEYIEDKNLGFCLGNAIKYISRAGKKEKDKEIQDLRKATWYIERRIYELENNV